ncbi:putative disease resistance protein rga3 [Phtheirospermum japonicum]|uniref:Putative disease resistance protein rga3 n=1 Tax=Phtheirospermum japonicum TaxID=374723 RepID=A0A830D0I9_9LAMI|nr:putative disease resistance protein rga3 [Phtheirospermum japonicum]
MAEAVVGATIQVLLEHLITISKEQISLVRDFKKDLENLKNSFVIVKAFLHDAERKQVTNEAVKIWLRNLEDLAFEADNVFDDISYQLLSKKVNKTVMKKVKSFFSCSSLQLGPRIKDLNDKLGSINQRATELGLQTIIANAQPPVSQIPETDSFSADPVYGREYDVSMIVKKLTTATPSPAKQVLSVLPIVGMGGLGKTTLARKVFGNEQIISHFGDNRVWVHVPRNFDARNILKNILTSLKNEKVELETRQALLQKLQEHLGTKRYLLVLDDVWDEERDKWDSFVNSLAGISSATGNCMIVTTRRQEVASIVKTGEVHDLGCLPGDDCWSIIEAKAFINSGDIPMEFETVGRNIAKRCQGLPLAAKVVGGLLRDKSKDEWREIENNWLSNFGDDQNTISKILKLSFDHLTSPSLKKCFAYCSIFPKGYQIEKEQLLELWMAEGFLQIKTTGSKFLNLLLQNSLLQVVERDDYGNVTHCNMHDLVHDLAFSVLCEYDNVTDGVCQRRGKVSDIRFLDFKSLHTLTLLGEDIDELPDSIGELKHLRYLDISGTSITFLPTDSIGELYHLQTLRAEVSNLEKLPDSLSCLISLRHLYISDDTALPPGIGKLTSLQTLSYFHVGDEKGYGISELGSLKDLKGKIEIRKSLPLCEGLNNLMKIKLQDCSECEELLMLGHLPHLKYLCLDGLTNVKSIRSSFYGKIDNCIRDPSVVVFPALERLELKWMPNLKEWDEVYEVVVFPRLEYLKVEGCRQLRRAPSHFPCLQELVMYEMESSLALENICGIKLTTLTNLDIRSIEGLKCLPDWLFSNNHNLAKLEILNCRNMTHLVPCLGGGRAPYLLRELRIDNCSSLRELPDDLHSLNSLEVLKISGCPDLKFIPYPISSGGRGQQSGFTSLRLLWILNLEGLTNLPIEMVESCASSLEDLILEGLSSITNLGMVIGCLHRMTRLTQLRIIKVPKFSPLSSSSSDIIGSLSTSNSLQVLWMSPLSSSSSWNNVSFNEAIDAMLPQFISLRILTLYGMEHWDCLLDQLQHLTSLEYLHLIGFGIEALPEWFGNLSSLKELYLWDCKKLRHLPSKQAMQRLSKLWIYDCPLLLMDKKRSNNNNNREKKRRVELPQIVDSKWPKISHIPNVYVDGHQISSDRH